MPQAPRHSPTGPRSHPQQGAEPDRAEPEAPELTDAELEPPAWLENADARDAWAKAIRVLRATHRRLNPSDLVSLSRYAEYVGNWHTHTRRIKDDGEYISNRFDVIIPHPAFAERAKCEGCIRSLEKALGLDPASFLDLTKDLSRAAKDKANQTRGGRGRGVGGFLNKKDKA